MKALLKDSITGKINRQLTGRLKNKIQKGAGKEALI